MRKVFILMLFVLNLVYFNHAMALSHIDQTVIANDEGKPDESKPDESKPDGDKGEEKNPEDDCD